jgi:hypothetical protein
MKQQKIKQLALLGLASGLLAATATAEAADKSSPSPRAANARSQPIAGCGSGGCGSIADNYNPSASCGASSSPRPANQNQNFAGCSTPSQPGYVSYNSQNDPHNGQLIQAGCASHEYSVNSPNEQYDPKIHGTPNLSVQTQQEPQSSFRYLGDTSQPPMSPSQPQSPSTPPSNGTTYRSPQNNGSNAPIQSASRAPRNSSRYLSDTATPPSNSMSSPSTPSSSYPSTSTPSSSYPSSSYSPQNTRSSNSMSDDSMNNPNTNTPPKTDSSKKTFW